MPYSPSPHCSPFRMVAFRALRTGSHLAHLSFYCSLVLTSVGHRVLDFVLITSHARFILLFLVSIHVLFCLFLIVLIVLFLFDYFTVVFFTMTRLLPVLSLVLLTTRALAATVSVNWDVTWVNASPDGFERPVIGIDNAWPCPTLEANAGDTIQLTINNKLGNETTGLHFHGIEQILTEDMDGPSGVTQCPVPPGSSITYTFVVCISVDW